MQFLLIDVSFGLTNSCFLGRNGSMSGDADSLDDFMSSLGTSLDKTTRTQIRRKIFDLKKVNLVITLNLPWVTVWFETTLVLLLCCFVFDIEIVPQKAKNMYMFLSLASQYVSYIFLWLLSTSFGSQHSISKIAFYACNVKW